MANDRMYLRCTGCGDRTEIAKHSGGAWFVYGPEDRRCQFLGLNDWFDRHEGCAEQAGTAFGLNFTLAFDSEGEE